MSLRQLAKDKSRPAQMQQVHLGSRPEPTAWGYGVKPHDVLRQAQVFVGAGLLGCPMPPRVEKQPSLRDFVTPSEICCSRNPKPETPETLSLKASKPLHTKVWSSEIFNSIKAHF